MTKTIDAFDRLADVALSVMSAVRPSDDPIGAAVTAAALLAQRAAREVSDRNRVIRIARREGATLRTLAEATGLSRQTIANQVPCFPLLSSPASEGSSSRPWKPPHDDPKERPMTKPVDALDRLAEAALSELSAVRPSDDPIGAAVAAASLLAQRAASEVSDRDRVIRIAGHEGASFRTLAEATGLSRQTIANICANGEHPRRPVPRRAAGKRARAT